MSGETFDGPGLPCRCRGVKKLILSFLTPLLKYPLRGILRTYQNSNCTAVHFFTKIFFEKPLTSHVLLCIIITDSKPIDKPRVGSERVANMGKIICCQTRGDHTYGFARLFYIYFLRRKQWKRLLSCALREYAILRCSFALRGVITIKTNNLMRRRKRNV